MKRTFKYPESETSIEDMCDIIKFLGIEKTEYTDCTILYEVTFDQLRLIYNMGKDRMLAELRATAKEGR